MLSLQNLFILYYYSDDVKMKKTHKYLELEMKEKKHVETQHLQRYAVAGLRPSVGSKDIH